MEPQGFPINDPGPQALMTSLTPEQNLDRLDLAAGTHRRLCRCDRGVGPLRGERFAALPTRSTLYWRNSAGAACYGSTGGSARAECRMVWSRSIDLVIDEPATRPDIDAKLDQLGQLAQDRGVALGLVTRRGQLRWTASPPGQPVCRPGIGARPGLCPGAAAP